ncbi:MAG: FUSC family protein [Bacteroidetes bacterium]|nr:FUSC family protein [Bacteroidota bacterium]
MDLNKEYKNFVYSHNFADGLRITAGVALPSIILNYAGLLPEGILASLGALCISITDNPGPIHYRRNGMLVCLIMNFIVTLIISLSLFNPVLTGCIILICCFIFSMAGIYGSRANAIGVSALIILVISLNHQVTGTGVVMNALWIMAGGVWYILLSLTIQFIQPYRLTQQVLGDLIISTASYLRIRSEFYQSPLQYQATYQKMMEMQAALLQKQNLVRELIFKTRKVTRESTIEGKTLLLIYLDITELFERLSASFQDYRVLHKIFPERTLFDQINPVILLLADELDEIGIAVLSGQPSHVNKELKNSVSRASIFVQQYEKEFGNTENKKGFSSFHHILKNLEDILSRLHTLHLYTRYDKKKIREFRIQNDYDAATPRQKYNWHLLTDSFTLKSNIFRHALRVSIATMVGYAISFLFPVGHNYWILLTIIVILKPAYSLTRKRNIERLAGTIAGAILGVIILYFIKDKTALFIIMLFLMTGTYSLLKTKYIYSVILMTPYILVLFHLLNSQEFNQVLTDRVVDTAIGSAIAFMANWLLFPAWSHRFFKKYLADYLQKAAIYFDTGTSQFLHKTLSEKIMQSSRKDAFVSLANLSDAFSQMLSEPKQKKVDTTKYQELVTLCHMLSSHIATLVYFSKSLPIMPSGNIKTALIESIEQHFRETSAVIAHTNLPQKANSGNKHFTEKSEIHAENTFLKLDPNNTEHNSTIQKQFTPISEQFNLIEKIMADILRLCRQLL